MIELQGKYDLIIVRIIPDISHRFSILDDQAADHGTCSDRSKQDQAKCHGFYKLQYFFHITPFCNIRINTLIKYKYFFKNVESDTSARKKPSPFIQETAVLSRITYSVLLRFFPCRTLQSQGTVLQAFRYEHRLRFQRIRSPSTTARF